MVCEDKKHDLQKKESCVAQSNHSAKGRESGTRAVAAVRTS